jgi:type I restriction enzyme M protein
MKTGKEKDKGWTCDLVPKQLVIDNYFAEDKLAIEDIEATTNKRKADARMNPIIICMCSPLY